MSNPNNLRELIRSSFDENELQDLVFDLSGSGIDVDYEDLPAIGRAGKIRELIKFCDRQGVLPQLMETLRQARPHIEWPDASQPLTEADLLGEEAKPQLPYEPEMVGIPAGPFLMGSDEENESPPHQVELAEYWIGFYPITNAQYAEFIGQTGHPPPKKVGWLGKKPPQKKLEHPAVGVSWHDAIAYCQWLSQQTGRQYRLPSEAEWEKAARGEDRRIYPWGNEWDETRCNFQGSDTTSVMAHPKGESPYGCQDMVGNVWEWTSTCWGGGWQISDFPYPYTQTDGREDLQADNNINRIFRGGSYDDEQAKLRCSARRFYAPNHQDKRRGFRVAMTRQPS